MTKIKDFHERAKILWADGKRLKEGQESTAHEKIGRELFDLLK